MPIGKGETTSRRYGDSDTMGDRVKSEKSTGEVSAKAFSKALEAAKTAEERAVRAEERAAKAIDKSARAKKKAKRSKKRARRADQRSDLAQDRADRALSKTRRWKHRARNAETQVAVLQHLNAQLTASYREDRAADATALHFATEAVAAFAADAVALREISGGEDCSDYLDHLTFRLRQNLLEARSFLDELGEVGHSADLADMLNTLPPDNSHRG